MLSRKLTILLILIVTPVGIFAGHSPTRSFTSADGLAGDTINRITRDSRGFLWFCTPAGVSRFDGQYFKNYDREQGLPSNDVIDFFEASNGTYFVATSNGLVIFDPTGRAYRWNIAADTLERSGDEGPMFTTVFPPDAVDRTERIVSRIGEDHDGRIYAGTMKTVYRVEKVGDGWTMRRLESPTIRDRNISISGFGTDKFGFVWFTGNDGIYRIDPSSEAIEKIHSKGGDSILSDRDGNIWITSGGEMLEGLRFYTFDENSRLVLTRVYSEADGLKLGLFMRDIIQAASGKIFVVDGTQLYEFVREEGKFRLITEGHLTSVIEDPGGNLWLGTDDRGATKLFLNGLTIFDNPDGIGPENISSIFTNRDGEFCVTLGERKLGRFVDGKFEFVEPLGVTSRSWGNSLLDLQDRDGEWWLPAYDGLRHYPKVAKFSDLSRTPPKKVYTTADGLFGNEIFNLFPDSHGDLWFTTLYTGDALHRLERATGIVHRYTLEDGVPKNNGAFGFAEDLAGNLWLGLYYGDLLRYRDGKFRLYTSDDGVPKSSIANIFRDSVGRMWISTASRGVIRIDDPTAEDPAFKNVTAEDGLSSNQVMCTTEDRQGRIYLATSRGIDRLDSQTGAVKNLSPSDGLPGNIVSLCHADKSGNLWFAVARNLIRVTPQESAPQQPSQVFIGGVRAGRLEQRVSELGETNISGFNFGSDQREVQIDFFALGYSNADRPRYQYRLNDQEWSSLSDQRTVDLNLAPGNYSFAVRAVSSDGVASERPATVAFSIAPPFWQTWVFRGVVALAVVLVLVWLDRVRAKRRRERRAAADALARANSERLKELEQVRRRIATDLHDDIGSSLTQISILSEVVRQRVSTEQVAVAEPLSMIADSSRELVDSMSDIVWAINPQKDHLRDLVQRMRRFASDIFAVREIEFSFEAPAAEIEIGANIRREIFLIFKEAVHNIVKHADCTFVEIELKTSSADLELIVRDNGRGFDMEQVAHEGHGLMSIRERILGVGGRVEIVSDGGGTMLRATVPLLHKSGNGAY